MRTGPIARPIADRMRDRTVVMPNGCHEWQGATRSGYGVIVIGSRSDGSRHEVRAHRLAWELANGPIPDGLLACHHCDNRPCVNVEHLFLGTIADNIADMDAKGRRVNTPHSGAANGRTKLSAGKAAWIRAAFADGMTGAAIAKALGISKGLACRVIRGEKWAA